MATDHEVEGSSPSRVTRQSLFLEGRIVKEQEKNPPEIEVREGNADLDTFCMKIDSDTDMDAVNDFLAEQQDAMVEYIKKLSKELGVSEETANMVAYLRSRSRWSEELEKKVIEAGEKGEITMLDILNGWGTD